MYIYIYVYIIYVDMYTYKYAYTGGGAEGQARQCPPGGPVVLPHNGNRSESATQRQPFRIAARNLSVCKMGHLAQNKTLAPLGPPLDPRHRPTVGS
jgi:hypothetical protein